MNALVRHVDATAAALYYQTSFVTDFKILTMVYLISETRKALTLMEIRREGRILGTQHSNVVCHIFGNTGDIA